MFDSDVILVADADDRLRGMIARELATDEATVLVADRPAQATARAATHRPAAAVIGDLGSPRETLEFIRAVRHSTGLRGEPAADLRILVLVDDEQELAVLRAFEAGADDVADRTASYPILRARLTVLLERSGSRTCTPSYRFGSLEVSLARRRVWLRGEPVELSPKEFELLAVLVSEPTRVFTRADLLTAVWGFGSDARTRTLDSHACRLRTKLGVHGDRFLVSVWGVGYRLIDTQPRSIDAAA